VRSELMLPHGRRSIVRFSRLAFSMSAFSISTLALILAPAGGTAWAQALAPPVKIAVIDMQSAMLSTNDGQKAAAELKAKFLPKQQELEKRSQELAAKQEQYRKTENTISDEAKATLARDIDTMTKNLQRDTDDARQDAEQEQQKVLNELGQKMMQVLQKYAIEKQITMVMDVSGQPNNVLFASNQIEITRDIIAMYNAAAPMTAVPPAKASPNPSSSAPAPKAPAARPATPPAASAPKQ
jgi:outer membrane protein